MLFGVFLFPMQGFRIKIPLSEIWTIQTRFVIGILRTLNAKQLRQKAAYPTYSPADIGGRSPGEFWDDALVTRVEIETSDDAGASQCVLYTQLSNPQSNAISRRLGYEPVVEQLRYRFG